MVVNFHRGGIFTTEARLEIMEKLMWNHGDTEPRRELILEALTREIIGGAIEVHKMLGPGLLESAYEQCLCHELALRSIRFERQVELPVLYKGVQLDCGYRVDLLVEDSVVVELKAHDRVTPVHEAQLLTYMRLASKKVGLILNFNVSVMTRGIVRKVL